MQPLPPTNLYHHHFPKRSDLVVCKTLAVSEMGLKFQLVEYEGTDLTGTATIKDMVRKKYVSNIRSLSKIGDLEILEVTDLEASSKHVGLSKRNVSVEDKERTLSEYKKNQKGYDIIKRLVQKLSLTAAFWDDFVYPLLAKHHGLHDALQCLRNDLGLLGGYDRVAPEVLAELAKIIKSRFQVRPIDVWSQLTLAYYGPEGVAAIRSAIQAGVMAATAEMPIAVHYVCAPVYMIKSTTQNIELAIEHHRRIGQAVETALRGFGGPCRVVLALNTTGHQISKEPNSLEPMAEDLEAEAEAEAEGEEDASDPESEDEGEPSAKRQEG